MVKGVGAVWRSFKSNCICLAESITCSTQGDDSDENCSYCIQDSEGGDIHMVTTSCQKTDSHVCVLMNKLERPTAFLPGCHGEKNNEQLTPMMVLALSIAY